MLEVEIDYKNAHYLHIAAFEIIDSMDIPSRMDFWSHWNLDFERTCDQVGPGGIY